MKNERNRKRPIQVTFFVNAAELDLIKQRMTEFGMDNLSAYLRKMALDGICKNTKADENTKREIKLFAFQHQRCTANFFEIVKGFGMFPNKYARVGTSVHCWLCIFQHNGKNAKWVPPRPAFYRCLHRSKRIGKLVMRDLP